MAVYGSRNWFVRRSIAISAMCAPLAFAGCGGSDAPPANETAQEAPAAQAPAPADPPAAPAAPPEAPITGAQEQAEVAPPGEPEMNEAAQAVPQNEEQAEMARMQEEERAMAEAERLANSDAEIEQAERMATEGQPSQLGAPPIGDEPANSATMESWLAGMAMAVMAPEGQPGQQNRQQTIGAGEPPIDPRTGELMGSEGELPPGAEMSELGADPEMAPGAEPGFPGGEEGMVPRAGAEEVTVETEKGTADYAVQQLVLKMKAGTTEGMDELIGERTNDKILAPLRDETATPEQLKEAQALVQGAKLIRSREVGTTKLFHVSTSAGKALTFTVRRDDGRSDYKVNSLKVETPRKLNIRRRR